MAWILKINKKNNLIPRVYTTSAKNNKKIILYPRGHDTWRFHPVMCHVVQLGG
jgi:hypothetical protein